MTEEEILDLTMEKIEGVLLEYDVQLNELDKVRNWIRQAMRAARSEALRGN